LENSKFQLYRELIPFEIAIEKKILPLKNGDNKKISQEKNFLPEVEILKI